MEFKKPELTKKQERIDKTIALLKRGGYVSKKQIAEELGLSFPQHDRQIRDIVADISQKFPIISTSDTNKGYKMAQGIEDEELAKHGWAEIDSRIAELSKRKKPLIKFLDERGIKLTLF